MIANLKAKAEGFDRKRIYTAAAALVIAGAAGHVMQRNANAPEGTPMLTASVNATPSVAVAGMAPAKIPNATPDQSSELVFAEAPQANIEAAVADMGAPKIVLAESTAQPAESQSILLEDMAQAPAPVLDDPEPTAPASEEVTRSASEPILALTDAAVQTGESPAATEPLTLATADEAIDLVAESDPAIARCQIAFDATPQPGAMIALTLSAPCNAGGKVEFEHAGLKFSDQLGPEGDFFLLVPAMSEDAIIVASFAAGQSQSAKATLPDFAKFERVALMWKGATGLQLHALENGSSYGDPGHVWAEAPATPEAATTGTGGFLSVLGSTAAGYAADVYTYPAGLMADGVEPRVSIEAQVMENTCGSRIEGRVLRTNAGRTPTAEPLEIAVPGCDAVGEYLVLNNLPQDLKLARN